MTVDLTFDEIALLIRALESHQYWELADPEYRRDGFVLEPGASNAQAQEQIERASQLAFRLDEVLRTPGASE